MINNTLIIVVCPLHFYNYVLVATYVAADGFL